MSGAACQLHQPVHLVWETAPLSASGIPRKCLKKRAGSRAAGRSVAVTHFSCLPRGANDKAGRGQTRDAAGEVKRAAHTVQCWLCFALRLVVDRGPMKGVNHVPRTLCPRNMIWGG